MISFSIASRESGSRARAGRIETRHGAFETPAFMPVGTKAAVKTLQPAQLRDAGTQILLCNAYHLALRPGEALVAKMGGLHRFMGWSGPILTDSGGYQVFSLAKLRKVSDEGVEFQSHLDGSTVRLSPERALEIQRILGADIVMPLDEPAPFPSTTEQAEIAVKRTAAWLERSVKARQEEALFGIVQGGTHPELRRRSSDDVNRHDMAGVAIGGLSLGEPAEQMIEMAAVVCAASPEMKPRYAMGIGTPADIVNSVLAGVDLFDCILPTRLGRNGWAFTSEGMLKIRNAAFKEDERPIDPACACAACRGFSRSYLRHCFSVDEILGLSMLSLHNVTYYQNLMKRIRVAIGSGTLAKLAKTEAERCPPLNSR